MCIASVSGSSDSLDVWRRVGSVESAFRGETHLAQNFGCMLAKARRVPAEPEWRGSEADRLSDGVIGTLGRMLADRHQINRTDMGILSDLFDPQDGHAGNVNRVAKGDPIGSRALRRLFPDHRVERF